MQDPATPTGLGAVLIPRAHDLGGFEVRRALPPRERQRVGPFVFFDRMGPGEFLTGRIEQAKADWRAGRFAALPGDEEEFIPLP